MFLRIVIWKIKVCKINKVWPTVGTKLYKLIIPFSMPKWDTALFFFLQPDFPLLRCSTADGFSIGVTLGAMGRVDFKWGSPILGAFGIVTKRTSKRGRTVTVVTQEGAWVWRINCYVGSLRTAKEEPAFILRFIVSLICLPSLAFLFL